MSRSLRAIFVNALDIEDEDLADELVCLLESDPKLREEVIRRSVRREHVLIPIDVADIVMHVFLPLNPNKMRKAAIGVREAAHAFKDTVRDAIGVRDRMKPKESA